MKKKVIAVIMTAAIVMGMAACGGKDAGDSVPAAGVSAEDSTGVDSTDEIGASDEQNSDEADSSGDGGSEEADMEDSQTSEEESSEAVAERNSHHIGIYGAVDCIKTAQDQRLFSFGCSIHMKTGKQCPEVC